MKKLFLLAPLLCSWPLLHGQNIGMRAADSLRHELKIAQADTSRILIMISLAEAVRGEVRDSTLYYAKRALELSRQINYPVGELRALLAHSIHYLYAGEMAKGLDTSYEALRIAEQHNLKSDQAFALIRIGNMFVASGDGRKAIHYFLRARRLTEDGSHPFFYAVTFYRSAAAYQNLSMPDSALSEALIAHEKATALNNLLILEPINSILGSLYAQRGDYEVALRYYRNSVATGIKRGASPSYSYLNIANLYRSQDQHDSAVYYAQKAYDMAMQSPVLTTQLGSARMLSSLYETEDPATAIRYLKLANTIRDSIYSSEKIRSLQSVAKAEEERQIEMMYAEKEYQSQIRQLALAVGMGVVVLIAGALYRNNRIRQKANVALQEQKEKVEHTLAELRTTQSQLIQSEKMASLGELTAGIAHEIQNPLNFVNNFSEVNSELVSELGAAMEKGDLSEVRNLVRDISANESKINHHGKRADAIVKSMLQHSRRSAGQMEPTDINALCDEYIRLAYHGWRAKDRSFSAQFVSNLAADLPMVNIVSQDIGRAILNLINNAFHTVSQKAQLGFPGYEPTVTIITDLSDTTTSPSLKRVEIIIKDNGNGIPDILKEKIFLPFFTTKAAGEGTGLGLSLSYDIIKAHGGELTLTSEEGVGTEFRITLPVQVPASNNFTVASTRG
jgi:signal transduction histidine kinase